MLIGTLSTIALGLLIAMFATRQMMLGFPAMIFWALLGGYCYQQSTVVWDLYFLFAFACLLGMTTFCGTAMYGLRTKKQEAQEGDQFIDEGGSSVDNEKFIDETKQPAPSRGVQGVRERAERRRTRGVTRKTDYGEFS